MQSKQVAVNPETEEGSGPSDAEDPGAASPRRRYRSPRREEQARQTRMAILDAAQELFIDRGYVATTVADARH